MSAQVSSGDTPGGAAFDEAALLHLLGLAGPRDAQELLRRLTADLRSVAEGLIAALAARDSGALRQHSHVLIAVAGTIGAEGLARLARTINQAARSGADPAPVAEVAEAAQAIGAVIADLALLAADIRPDR